MVLGHEEGFSFLFFGAFDRISCLLGRLGELKKPGVGNKMDRKIWNLESSKFDIDIDILHSYGAWQPLILSFLVSQEHLKN